MNLSSDFKPECVAPPRIDVWMDFVCPQCFLAALELGQLRREQAVNIRWRSLLLRPPGSGPMPLEAKAAESERRRRLAERIQIEHGIVLQPGPAGIETYLPHLAVKHARARNKGGELHGALMRAYWLEGRSIADADVIKEIALQVDLDAADLAARLNEPAYAEAVALDAQSAARLGVRGAPALLFVNKYLVSSSQPADVWRQVLRRVRASDNHRIGLGFAEPATATGSRWVETPAPLPVANLLN